VKKTVDKTGDLQCADSPQGTLTIQTLAMPADTNVHGDIFGGWLVSQMDLAAGVLAKQICKGRAVTVAINSMVFHHPVHVGDIVSCHACLIKQGNTSMTIQVEVWTNVQDPGRELKVTEGTFVFVAVDNNGRPRPVSFAS